MKANKRHYWEKLANNRIIQKSIKDLQKIVDSDDGITGISISCGDSKVEFKKTISEVQDDKTK